MLRLRLKEYITNVRVIETEKTSPIAHNSRPKRHHRTSSIYPPPPVPIIY